MLDFGGTPKIQIGGREVSQAEAIAMLAGAKKYNAYSTPEMATWFRQNILEPWRAHNFQTRLFRSGHVSNDTLRQKILGATRYIIDHERDEEFTKFWATVKVRKAPEGISLSIVPAEVEILTAHATLDNIDYIALKGETHAWVSAQPAVGDQFEKRGLNLSAADEYYYKELLDNLRPYYVGSVGQTYIHFKRVNAPSI